MPHKDRDKRRAADRARQRRHRSTPTTNGSETTGGRDKQRKVSHPGGLDPAAVLVRLAAELEALDAADPPLDPAMRARTVARVCAVALAAYRQAPDDDDDDRWNYGDLTSRELATLRRLVGKVRRAPKV